MNRRHFLSTLTGAALAAPSILRAARQPNLLIVLCDDLGYGDLGCFGSPTIRTPSLDRFATHGVKFTDCYAAAPVCSPSRAGMLSGRTPDRCGVHNWIPGNNPMHLRRNELTFARLLKDAGYATCHSGKWHCNGKFNSPEQPQPGDHGFDHWFSTQNNAAPTHQNPVNFVRNGVEVGETGKFSATLIVDEAIAWMNRLEKNQPFCSFVCFHNPHEPIASSPRFVDMYPDARKRGEALYYSNVTEMDHEFGRLVKAVDDSGRAEETFILFTSDNGPETLDRYPGAWRSHGSPDPLRGMKLSMYEGGYRVPGIIRYPPMTKAGTVSHEPISGVDVLPTLCELGGATAPSDRPIDGTSFTPALSGRKVNRDVPLHWHYYNAMGRPKASLRDGDWKIVGIPAKDPLDGATGGSFRPEFSGIVKGLELHEFELYNLNRDMRENNNLARREPARLKQMSEQLVTIHDEVKAEAPDWRTPSATTKPAGD
jgi:arylsulfatase